MKKLLLPLFLIIIFSCKDKTISSTLDVCGVKDVTVALPRLVGGAGVIETFPLPPSPAEQDQLRTSAGVIRRALDELDRPEA